MEDSTADLVSTPSVSSLTLAFEVSRLGRKQFVLHENPFEDESFRFPEGSRILVVEDVVVSGRSLDLARSWCEARGATVDQYAVLVDRRADGAGDHGGVPLVAVIRHPVTVWPDAETCPLCLAGSTPEVIAPNYPKRVVHQ